ncbi:MAG: hypothetical protein QN649_02960 [Nitrososphaeraceae archaeon]|nr:hypothetical protein [Nitrososphaeraceae archaeon]
MSGLELCPKCKKGHLYPVVTAYASASAEPKRQFKETGGVRDYECDICGHKQKATKLRQNVDVKDEASASVKKTKKPKPKPKPKTKTKTKPKPKPKPKPKTKRKRG